MASELERELPGDADVEAGETDRHANGKPVPKKPAPPPEPDEGADEAFEHNPRLVKVARTMGFSTAEIDATPTEQLWLAVQQEHAARQAEGRATPRAEEPKRPEPKPEPRDDDEEFDHEIEVAEGKRRRAKLSDYDPVVQKLYRENKALKGKLEEKEKSDAEATSRTVFGMIDEAFEGLPDAARKFFGEGPVSELHQAGSADELARRNAVAAAAGIQKGDSQRVIDRKVKRAVGRLYPTGFGAKEEEEAVEEYGAKPARNGKPKNGKPARVEKWERAAVARPTGRRGSDVRGWEAALTAIEQAMEAAGMDPGRRKSHALEDELPGDDDI